MRYVILKPKAGTIDPRTTSFASFDELHALAPPLAEFTSEAECAAQIRLMYPDAVTLPMRINLASGKAQTVVLGVIDDEKARQTVDVNSAIPFACLVQAISETEVERMRLKKGDPPFTMNTWRLKPVCPSVYKATPVEVRSSDAAAPVFTTARVGRHRDQLAVFIDAEGVQFSLVFEDKKLGIVEQSDGLDMTDVSGNVLAEHGYFKVP